MRRIQWSGMLACLVTTWMWQLGSAASAAEPRPCPDDGVVANGVYANEYFDLSYPLPSGWAEDVAGAAPSTSGYYVLAAAKPAGALTGTVMIAAQDAFFTDTALDDVRMAAREFTHSIAEIPGMTIDQPPAEVVIAHRAFTRVDFSGVGLFRSTFFTANRCHVVSFNFTAKSPELLATLVASLDGIRGVRAGTAATSDPGCARNQAAPENVVTKVDPAGSDPKFVPIPVRLVIGADGAVRHVHVIRASEQQRSSIESALGQWRFKPRASEGGAAEVETGLLIEFTSSGVAYPSVPHG
jgi:hypothetical protein